MVNCPLFIVNANKNLFVVCPVELSIYLFIYLFIKILLLWNYLVLCMVCEVDYFYCTNLITHFQVVFRLCFKVSPCAKPFTWKLVLFTCKWTKLCMWIKLIFIWKAFPWDSLWNRGNKRQLRNGLSWSGYQLLGLRVDWLLSLYFLNRPGHSISLFQDYICCDDYINKKMYPLWYKINQK